MTERMVSDEGVHLMHGEFTLCGDSFDIGDTEDDAPSLRPTRLRTVTCERCVEIIVLAGVCAPPNKPPSGEHGADPQEPVMSEDIHLTAYDPVDENAPELVAISQDSEPIGYVIKTRAGWRGFIVRRRKTAVPINGATLRDVLDAANAAFGL